MPRPFATSRHEFLDGFGIDVSMMLVIFDPVTNFVKRVVIPGLGENIDKSHVQNHETSIFIENVEATEKLLADPFDRDALATALAAHGLILP